jgi:hypothetical protein
MVVGNIAAANLRRLYTRILWFESGSHTAIDEKISPTPRSVFAPGHFHFSPR